MRIQLVDQTGATSAACSSPSDLPIACHAAQRCLAAVREWLAAAAAASTWYVVTLMPPARAGLLGPALHCLPSRCVHQPLRMQIMAPFEVLYMQVSADDYAVVWVDGAAVLTVPQPCSGCSFTAPALRRSAGMCKVVVAYTNLAGSASLSLLMGFNTTTYSAVPMRRVFPVQPGAAAQVTLRVNGVQAQPLCNSSTLSASPRTVYNAASLIGALEPTSVTVPAGTCGYLYSTIHSPTNAMLQALLQASTRLLGRPPNTEHGVFSVGVQTPCASAGWSCNLVLGVPI